MFKLITLYLLIFCSCINLLKTSDRIRGVRITEVFPNMTGDGKVFSYDTPYVKLYYYGEYILCHLSYQFDSVVENVNILSENRYHYIFYKKGSNYGYDLDEHKSRYITKVPLDSVFKMEWVFQLQIYSIFTTRNKAELISSRRDKRAGSLKEEYIFKGIEDSSRSGFCYLEFTNRMKKIEFSLSKELDSIKKMKLERITIVNNPRYFEAGGVYLERIKTGYWLEEIKDIDTIKIRSLFKFFEKSSDY